MGRQLLGRMSRYREKWFWNLHGCFDHSARPLLLRCVSGAFKFGSYISSEYLSFDSILSPSRIDPARVLDLSLNPFLVILTYENLFTKACCRPVKTPKSYVVYHMKLENHLKAAPPPLHYTTMILIPMQNLKKNQKKSKNQKIKNSKTQKIMGQKGFPP
jgi:hypothetical protein